MNYFIGIDSGGTKTEAVLVDEQGHILKHEVVCGCNPMDVGVAAARETILSVIDKLDECAPQKVKSIYAGIAGVNRISIELDDVLKNKYGFEYLRVEDDRRIVLSSMLGHANGCGLICGTGSSLSIIRENEPITQIGGLGYLIDTCGSGFELGQAALKQAFRYLDGRGEYTALVEIIEKAIGKNLWDGLGDIYLGGRPFIASLARTVFEGMTMGDKVSRRIAEAAADSLAELINVAGKHFDGAYSVVMTGGILHAYPEYADMICAKVQPQAKMIMASAPPVYGAFVESMWQCGMNIDGDVRSTFLADYKKLHLRH